MSEKGTVDDLIINGQLQINTTATSTIPNSEYSAIRGLTASDAKVQYRYKANITDVAVTEVEYFEDIDNDAIDFNDSTYEHFAHVDSDPINFNDGTVEGFTDGDADTHVSNSNSKTLKVFTTTGAGQAFKFNLLSQSINADTYRYLRLRYNTSNTFGRLIIQDGSTNWIVDENPCSTGCTANTMYDHIFDLESAGSDWASSETGFYFIFIYSSAVSATMYIDHVGLYKTADSAAKGEVDGFTGLTGEFQNYNEDGTSEDGYYTGIVAAAASDSILTKTSYTIDPTVYFNLSTRIKSDSAVNYTIYAHETGGAGVAISDTYTLTVDTWEQRNLSLEDLTAYNSLSEVDYFYYYIVDDSGNLEGTERITIEYLRLYKPASDSSDVTPNSFVIGLYNQNDLKANLMNVSHYFYNKTHFRWEIKLFDSDDLVSAYYYSSVYDITNIYYRNSIIFNVLTSEFSVEIKTDGGSRIFKANYPDDFTNSGTIPSLFAHEKSPDIFFSTNTVANAKSLLYLDFISTKFKEREWRQTTSPNDNDWIVDTPLIAKGQDTLTDISSQWELTIPYLDSMSGRLWINISDSTAVTTNDQSFYIYMQIYGIDGDDGEDHLLTSAYITQQRGAGSETTWFGVLGVDESTIFTIDKTPFLDFNFNTRNDRSDYEMSVRYGFEGTDEDLISGVYSNNLSNVVDDPSQEYKIKMNYFLDLQDNIEVTLDASTFAFFERDVLTDFIISFVVGETVDGWIGDFFGGFAQLIIALFRWAINLIRETMFDGLFNYFGGIWDVMTVQLGDVIAGLTDLPTALKTIWETIITGLQNGIGSIMTGVETTIGGFINDVETAIDGLLALGNTIWTGFINVFSDILEDFGQALAGFWADYIDPLINTVVTSIVNGLIWGVNLLFNIWDAIVIFILVDSLGMTDFKSLLDSLVVFDYATSATNAITFVSWIGGNIVIFFLIIVALVYTIPMMSGNDISQGLMNTMQINAKDATGGTSGLGFAVYVPVGLVVVLFYLILTSTGSVYNILGSLFP